MSVVIANSLHREVVLPGEVDAVGEQLDSTTGHAGAPCCQLDAQGLPGNAFAGRSDLLVVEDSADTLGATLHGSSTGTPMSVVRAGSPHTLAVHAAPRQGRGAMSARRR